ncbi:MAG: SDR family NAD(P)-dependent oxidoreductase [Hyphomonadaceae bacterium]
MNRRYALITGASSGIGAAMAQLIARDGFDIGLVARRGDRLLALADGLRAHGVEVDVFPADLSTPRAGERLAIRVAEAQRTVSVLVNNAGVTLAKSFSATTLCEQQAFVELTIQTPVALTHAFLPSMLADGYGRIINIGSITALSSGGKGNTLYPAGKSFLLKFSQSLSAEVKPRGVLVSAVLPGFVATEFQHANGLALDRGGEAQRFAQSAEDVAREAWTRNGKGHEIVVPGLSAKGAAALMRLLPEPLMRTLTRAAAEKYYVGD